MNPRIRILVAVAAAWAALPVVHAARQMSDLLPTARRQASVDIASRLTADRAVEPLPGNVVNPFNPPNFQAPDPEELRAAAEAARRAAAANAGPSRPSTPKDLLAAIAAQIRPTGTVQLGGAQILLIGPKKLRVGDVLAVTYEGQPVNLTITYIDRSTFSLRLGGEEINRPIKNGANP